ncbi:MAG TPA: 50S ribosomal protein L4 [Anaerolineae bacterium]|nr:50S ribosomal protein L4 [Anaerolineae bacterium]
MKVDVLNMKGEKIETTDLSPAIFEAPIKPDLMHQALVRQLANARRGTQSVKRRSEVSGGGRKPWRQKGTGRARQGSTRSPQWVGGGKAHAPKPRSYAMRMPRKMRRAALRSALSVKASRSEITVLDKFVMEQPKTKEMAAILKRLVGDSSVLILLPEKDSSVEKSAHNLPRAATLLAQYLNVRDLLHFDRVILPLEAIPVIEANLGG